MTDPIESAAAVMVRDYVLLAFLVSLGALQIATSISETRGLWIIPHKLTTRILGILLIILGLAYYISQPPLPRRPVGRRIRHRRHLRRPHLGHRLHR